jgi:hypothetical protein
MNSRIDDDDSNKIELAIEQYIEQQTRTTSTVEKRKLFIELLDVGDVMMNGFLDDRPNRWIRRDKECVMASVKKYGRSVKWVHHNFYMDKDVMLEAVKQDEYAMNFAHKSLLADENFMLEAINYSAKAVRFVDDSLGNDKDFILKAVNVNDLCYRNIFWSHSKNKEIAIAASRAFRLRNLIKCEKRVYPNSRPDRPISESVCIRFYGDPDVYFALEGRLNMYHSLKLNTLCTINFIF